MNKKSQYSKLDPFSIEILRNYLAKENSREDFLKTYRKEFAEIKNLNSRSFWNNHFNSEETIEDLGSMTQEKLDRVISLIPNKRLKILDLGFGQGHLEEKINSYKRKYHIYGIDISDLAVKRAKKKFAGNFIHGNIKYLNKYYKRNSFDVIVALELIEHIPPSRIFKFYQTIHSLLKKGGILIITTPLNEGLSNKKENLSGHVRDYKPAVIRMELELSRFKILETYQLYAFKNFYQLKKFLVKILPWRWHPNNIIVKAVKV